MALRKANFSFEKKKNNSKSTSITLYCCWKDFFIVDFVVVVTCFARGNPKRKRR